MFPLLLLTLIFLVYSTGGDERSGVRASYCNFPSFLWQDAADDRVTVKTSNIARMTSSRPGPMKSPGRLWFSHVTLKIQRNSGAARGDRLSDDETEGTDYDVRDSYLDGHSRPPPTQYYYKNLPFLNDHPGSDSVWASRRSTPDGDEFNVSIRVGTNISSKYSKDSDDSSIKARPPRSGRVSNYHDYRQKYHFNHAPREGNTPSRGPNEPQPPNSFSRFPTAPNSYREILVEQSQIKVKLLSMVTCYNKSANRSGTCYSKQEIQEISCLSEEVNEKYRVRIKSDGESKFGCMRFTRSWPNVVQVFLAQPKKINDARLCLDPFIKRSAYPWVAERKETWSFCPFSGGFDFRIYVTGRRKPLCGKSRSHWRPSRMESECIIGEGLSLVFQDSKCNFLPSELNGSTLICWGSFIEGASIYVFFGGINQPRPQYTLRLPNNPLQSKEMWATLYFSVYAPEHNLFSTWNLEEALAESNRDELTFPMEVDDTELKQVDLYLVKSDGGVCYDESDFCSEFAREGRCINSALHKFANFCKKSCGLCGHKADLVPSTNSECHFPVEYRGRWLLTESDHMEEVIIEEGQAIFSRLGTFICKSKHWKKEQYKVFSVYQNGCRPRYSCIHFRQEGKILYFQISRSSLFDNSFDLCVFRDDEEILKDAIRSKKFKMLIAHKDMKYDNCDLHGSVNIGVHFHPPGKASKISVNFCNGSLSDADTSNCDHSSVITLRLPNCPHYFIESSHHCVGSLDVDDITKVLITKLDQSFTCWVIFTHHERAPPHRPWKLIYVMGKGQCGHLKDVTTQRPPENVAMTIGIFSDSLPAPKCKRPTHIPPTLASKQKNTRKLFKPQQTRNTNSPPTWAPKSSEMGPNILDNGTVYSSLDSVPEQLLYPDYVESKSDCCRCCCCGIRSFVLLVWAMVVTRISVAV